MPVFTIVGQIHWCPWYHKPLTPALEITRRPWCQLEQIYWNNCSQRSRSLRWSFYGDEIRKRRLPHCPKHLPPLVFTSCTRKFCIYAEISHDGVHIRFGTELHTLSWAAQSRRFQGRWTIVGPFSHLVKGNACARHVTTDVTIFQSLSTSWRNTTMVGQIRWSMSVIIHHAHTSSWTRMATMASTRTHHWNRFSQRSPRELQWSFHGVENRKQLSPSCPKHFLLFMCTSCTRRSRTARRDCTWLQSCYRSGEEITHFGLVRHSFITHKVGEQLGGQVTQRSAWRRHTNGEDETIYLGLDVVPAMSIWSQTMMSISETTHSTAEPGESNARL